MIRDIPGYVTRTSIDANVAREARAKRQASRGDLGFLLIHGSGMGSWVWERVTPFLSIPSLAVDLPGRGKDPGDVSRLLVEGCALSVVQAVERSGFDRIVPVMHSYSGVLAPHIARRLPGRVAHLVFVATTNPPDGQRPLYPLLDRLVMRLQRLGVRLPRSPFRSAMRRAVLTDLDDRDVRWALERMTYAEPPALFLERVFYHGMSSIPRTYIQLLRDRAVPLATQRSAAGALRARLLSVDTGHAVMLSRPAELAALLNRVAGEVISTARRA